MGVICTASKQSIDWAIVRACQVKCNGWSVVMLLLRCCYCVVTGLCLIFWLWKRIPWLWNVVVLSSVALWEEIFLSRMKIILCMLKMKSAHEAPRSIVVLRWKRQNCLPVAFTPVRKHHWLGHKIIVETKYALWAPGSIVALRWKNRKYLQTVLTELWMKKSELLSIYTECSNKVWMTG